MTVRRDPRRRPGPSRQTVAVLGLLLGSVFGADAAHAHDLCGSVQGTLVPSESPYYVTCNVYVDAGSSLVIEPGVVLRFTRGTSMQVNGSLSALGLSQNGIAFKSDQSAPVPGDWNWIAVAGHADFAHIQVSYATEGVVFMSGATGSLTASAFGNTASNAVSLWADTWPELSDLTAAGCGIGGIAVAGGSWTTGGSWRSAGIPYVLVQGAVSFAAGAPLAIEAGTVLKLGAFSSLIVNDGLTALGTEEAPIVFTSLLDDTAGGDTNGDGSATTPSAGDWNRLELGPGGSLGHRLSWLDVRYAVEGAVFKTGARGTLSNSSFVDTSGAAVSLWVDAWPTLSGLAAVRGHPAGIWVASGIWSIGGTWGLAGIPYVLSQGPVSFAAGAPLAIEAGTVLKLGVFGSLAVNDGLTAPGIEEARIVFTSLLDDTAGGDTNGDGSATTPSAGDWNRLELGPGGSLGHRLSWLDVRYAVEGAVFKTGARGTLSNSSFVDTSGAAVSLWVDAWPTLSGLAAVRGHPAGIRVAAGVWNTGGTWYTAGIPYVLPSDGTTFATEAPLTIQPGNVVKLDTGGSLTVNDDLTALGLEGAPIVFTSILDDMAGGDTDGDGGAATPSAGDWDSLRLGVGGSEWGHQLSHLDVRYAVEGAVFETGARGTLSSSSFADTAGAAVSLWADAWPTLSGLAAVQGHPAGIWVASGAWSIGGTWGVAGIPYVLSQGPVVLAAGAPLTIEAGTVLKLGVSSSLTANGGLTALGSAGAPIVFTSLLDDSAGGDTNGDGGAGAPSAGDWDSLRLGPGYGEWGHQLSYLDVRYAVEGAVFETGAGGTLTASKFRDTSGAAVSLWPDAWPALTGLTATGCHPNGVSVDGLSGSWPTGGTWRAAGIPYVLFNSVVLGPNAPLTIEQGAVLKLESAASLAVENDLTAQGVAFAPIVITSLRDDTVGGDTNGDGAATSPAAGDWNWIRLGSSGYLGHALSRLDVRYAVQGLVFATDSTGTLADSTLRDTSSDSVALWPDALPSFARLQATRGHPSGIGVDAGTWTRSAVWGPAGIPYVLKGVVDFVKAAGLNLKAGTVVKSDERAALQVEGGLTVEGSPGAPIVATSLKDDYVLGDTNGDGSATTPSAGDWSGILLYGAGHSLLDQLEIWYAATGLSCAYGDVTIDGGVFALDQTGIAAAQDAALTMTRSSVTGCLEGVTKKDSAREVNLGNVSNADPQDDGQNDLVCNIVHVRNDGGSFFAQNDWWGDAPPPSGTIVGDVAIEPYLYDASGLVIPDLLVGKNVERGDVELEWRNRAPDCGYRVFRSTRPSDDFADVSGHLSESRFQDTDALIDRPSYFYLVGVD